MKYNRTLVTGARGMVGSTIPSEFKPTSTELDLMKYEDLLIVNANVATLGAGTHWGKTKR